MKPGLILDSKYRCDFEVSSHGHRTRYIATDLKNDSRVIIESLHETFIDDDESVNGLRYEINQSQKLTHEAFMKYKDSFTYKNILYLVWEYVDAITITQNKSLSNLSDRDICEFIAKLIDGITFAHKNGIIHGALSTDVVLVTPDLAPIIVGFAIPGTQISTDPGSVAGLSAYKAAAPELYEGVPIDESCDLYSVGAIAEFMFKLAAQNQTKKPIDHSSYQYVQAKSLIQTLKSPNRGMRIESANRILDPSFLDAMITPAHGNEQIKIPKRLSKRLKARHIPENASKKLIIVGLKAAFIASIALCALYLVYKTIR